MKVENGKIQWTANYLKLGINRELTITVDTHKTTMHVTDGTKSITRKLSHPLGDYGTRSGLVDAISILIARVNNTIGGTPTTPGATGVEPVATGLNENSPFVDFARAARPRPQITMPQEATQYFTNGAIEAALNQPDPRHIRAADLTQLEARIAVQEAVNPEWMVDIETTPPALNTNAFRNFLRTTAAQEPDEPDTDDEDLDERDE
jgi:hypothetical protein